MKKKTFRERHQNKDVMKEIEKEVLGEIIEPKKRGRKKKND